MKKPLSSSNLRPTASAVVRSMQQGGVLYSLKSNTYGEYSAFAAPRIGAAFFVCANNSKNFYSHDEKKQS